MMSHEAVRLRALYTYAVLDTPPEPNFDRITALAADIFQLPVCTMSLADAERHWFKSHYGVEVTEIPRRMSFCDETLRRPEGFLVADALADARFKDAPVVAGPPGFRFYAGCPLVTPGGQRIGSLCVLDTQPHHDFSDDRLRILANLAGTSMELLEARSRNRELERCTAELAHIAAHDSLTGMPNRRMLQQYLEDLAAADACGCAVAVLYIDLDHFKQVNDTFGHGAGDSLLKQVANRLRTCVRRSDRIARLGGDEFAVLLSGGTVRQDAIELAERLIGAISAPYRLGRKTVRIGASIGITVAAEHPAVRPRLDDMLKNADMALYEAKANGRSRYCCFDARAA